VFAYLAVIHLIPHSSPTLTKVTCPCPLLPSRPDPPLTCTSQDVLYGGKQRLDVDRLMRLADGLAAFTTDGLTSESLSNAGKLCNGEGCNERVQ
jgi:hypothetical protein